jgi:hypothetical protein
LLTSEESKVKEDWEYATANNLSELFIHLKDVRGADAEIWKTDMECMGQSVELCVAHGEAHFSATSE